MRNFSSWLAEADRVPVPDLWPEIERRAASHAVRDVAWLDDLHHRSLKARVAVAALAIAIAAGGTAFAWIAFRSVGGRPATSVSPEPSAVEDPWAGLNGGLNRLQAPPFTREGAALVWTGASFVVWGGSLQQGREVFDTGSAYDPRADRWSELPPAPLAPRVAPAAVWTGREVLIWGGYDPTTGAAFGDGAAYDPAERSWRMLPPAPLSPRVPFGAVWTGREMIVWGSSSMPLVVDVVDGAAYDPVEDAWRRIPEAPIQFKQDALLMASSEVWTGEEMVALGILRQQGEAEDSIFVAAYDPATDRWRLLPRPPLTAFAAGLTAVWAGTEVLAIDDYGRVSGYDPWTDTWVERPAVQVSALEPKAAFTPGEVFLATRLAEAIYDLDEGSWTDVSDVIPPANGFYLPVPAGSVILLWDVDPRGEPPPTLLAWKP